MPQTDFEIVREVRRGNLDAFHILVDRYASYLYRLAMSLVGNSSDAEDAVQETLAGAFRAVGSFREQSSVKTWLTRILVRQVARHFRREGSRTVVLNGAPRPALAMAGGTDVRIDVRAAILSLQPDHREVIVLRELNGFSYEEIAQALDVPRGTVESRLFRARQELQSLLKEYLT